MKRIESNPYGATYENMFTGDAAKYSAYEKGKQAQLDDDLKEHKEKVREIFGWIEGFGGLCNKFEGEDPEYGHQIQYWACIESLSEQEYEELGTYYRFVIEISRKDYKALKQEMNDGS